MKKIPLDLPEIDKFSEVWKTFVQEAPLVYPIIFDGAQQVYIEAGFDASELDLTLEDTGYTTRKLTQLKTYYMPEEQPERAIEIVKARIKKNKYGSAMIHHKGRLKKGFTAQDYCMMGTAITFYPAIDGLRFSTSWRSTEIIKRYRGDILFLKEIQEIVERELDFPVKTFSFHFHNFTWHSMFYLLIIPHIKWKRHLELLKIANIRGYKNVIRWLHFYLVDERGGVYKYSSAHQVLKIAQKQMSPKQLERVARYVKLNYVENRRGYK